MRALVGIATLGVRPRSRVVSFRIAFLNGEALRPGVFIHGHRTVYGPARPEPTPATNNKSKANQS